jgi:hypothetical protein
VDNLIFDGSGFFIMGMHRERGQLYVQGDFPYQEALLLENIYISYEQEICPRCGSLQITTYTNVISNLTESEPLSGDLKFRTLVVGKCLCCGLERPMRFKCIREA